jgi:hypothetical protein
MRTVAYYRQRAAECRTIAKQISLKEPRDQLLKMAQEWEGLATEREAELRKKADLAAAPEALKAAGE